jgi:hydrogenase maturation protein HypF
MLCSTTHRAFPGASTVKLTLCGHVQGVGFRPFVYRLAHEHGLTGYVQNRLGEVVIVATGRPEILKRFRDDLIQAAPPLAQPQIVEVASADSPDLDDFEIITSSATVDARVYVPADSFMCNDCKRDLHDPDDRHFRYPFINCTQCGPRYTLIEALPYDRPNTSMAGFPMCPECEKEYRDPYDRRFHAEPVSCPICGPALSLEYQGEALQLAPKAVLAKAMELLRIGQIIAVKGIGGYHLICDARNDHSVNLLRKRKARPDKPLAVMFPIDGADGLDRVRRHVILDEDEAALLKCPQRPIVLARKNSGTYLAESIAPGLRELGIILPYSPLHQLLLEDFDGPLVATSGNLSGEPVLTDNTEASQRLTNIADAFVHHNRPIVRPADDSVYRKIANGLRPIRIGRGAAPRELTMPIHQQQPTLAVGGHMKGTVALSWEDRVVVSPHIGEMDSPRSLVVFEEVAVALQSLYGVQAERIVCDAHPGYTTHRWARTQPLPVEAVWHHHAHASAVAGEKPMSGRWLVFTWDGVGFGEDGNLWGGEALLGKPGEWHRVASLKPFQLPGGERAGREPWRSAAALHWECGSEWRNCPDDDGLARAAWEKGLNCPQTTAMGRLFDAAAALITNTNNVSFEAQGPMQLESLCRTRREPVHTSLYRKKKDVWRSDWSPLLPMISDETKDPAYRAEVFHSSIAWLLLQQARTVREQFAVDQVGLSGGVFQNRFLTEFITDLLEHDGFEVILPSVLPCNDAALSFGQAVEVAARTRNANG